MSKVTYTIDQLEQFTVAELKTLDLYGKVENAKGLNKSDLVQKMFDAQYVEESNEESDKEEVKEEKIVFHRNNGVRRNPMTFR